MPLRTPIALSAVRLTSTVAIPAARIQPEFSAGQYQPAVADERRARPVTVRDTEDRQESPSRRAMMTFMISFVPA